MKVLFVCEGNMMRSQMGEAFYNHMTKSSDAFSAGATAETRDQISERAIEALAQVGVDASRLRPKQVTEEMLEGVDKIIYFPSAYMPRYVKEHPKAEFWDILDPHYHRERGMELVLEIRDDIRGRVETLIKETS